MRCGYHQYAEIMEPLPQYSPHNDRLLPMKMGHWSGSSAKHSLTKDMGLTSSFDIHSVICALFEAFIKSPGMTAPKHEYPDTFPASLSSPRTTSRTELLGPSAPMIMSPSYVSPDSRVMEGRGSPGVTAATFAPK